MQSSLDFTLQPFQYFRLKISITSVLDRSRRSQYVLVGCFTEIGVPEESRKFPLISSNDSSLFPSLLRHSRIFFHNGNISSGCGRKQRGAVSLVFLVHSNSTSRACLFTNRCSFSQGRSSPRRRNVRRLLRYVERRSGPPRLAPRLATSRIHFGKLHDPFEVVRRA